MCMNIFNYSKTQLISSSRCYWWEKNSLSEWSINKICSVYWKVSALELSALTSSNIYYPLLNIKIRIKIYHNTYFSYKNNLLTIKNVYLNLEVLKHIYENTWPSICLCAYYIFLEFLSFTTLITKTALFKTSILLRFSTKTKRLILSIFVQWPNGL